MASLILESFGRSKQHIIDAGQSSVAARLRGAPWTGELLAAAVLFLVTLALLLLFADDAPVHPDSCRDLLLARDVVEGGRVNLEGPASSFGRLFQGTLWSDFLGLAWLIGLGPTGMQVATWLLHALAVALLYVAARRYSTYQLALLAAVLFLVASPVLADQPLLFNPVLVPLPLVLFHFALAAFLSRGSTGAAVAASFFLAIAIEAHAVCLILVPLFLFCVTVFGRRIWLAVPASIAALLATLLVLSPTALLANIAYPVGLFGVGPWAAVAVILAVVTYLTRRRLVLFATPQRLLFVVGAELLIAILLLLAGPLLGWLRVEQRYLLPVAPGVAVFVALVLLRALAFARVRWPVVGARVRTEFVAAALVLAGAPWMVDALQLGDGSALGPAWRLHEARTLAGHLNERGYDHSDLRAHLQGPRFRELIGCALVFEPPSSNEKSDRPANLLALRLSANEVAQHPSLEAKLLPLGDGARLLLHESEGWVSRGEELSLCLQPLQGAGDNGDGCQDVTVAFTGESPRPGSLATHSPYEAVHGDDKLRRRMDRLSSGMRASYRMHVSPGQVGAQRLVSVLDLPEAACPWQIQRVEGVPFSGKLPATSVRLGPARSGSGNGWLTVAKTVGDATCNDPVSSVRFPPSIIELGEDEQLIKKLLQLPEPRG